MKLRVPIRYVTVFGVTALVALAVGIVFYLGFVSATKNTRQLMSRQAEVMIRTMERDIALWFRPVNQQASWVAEHLETHAEELSNPEFFDAFMLGALAATSQVAGIAIVRTDGLSRRWARNGSTGLTEDWSARADIIHWVEDAAQRSRAAWIEPFFTETIDKTVLLHDLPVRNADGRVVAILAQIVPIEELSSYVASLSPREGMTPFILYGKERVLAHPQLIKGSGQRGTAFMPLMSLDRLDDKILNRIWSPDEEELRFLDNTNKFQTSGAYIEEYKSFFVYLYHYITDYGPVPWIMGAYLDTDIYGGAESERLLRALLGSLAVLLLALAGAVFLGKYITRPVSAIAKAARIVEANELTDVPILPSSHMREIDDAARSFNQMVVDLKERTLIRQTLGQFVPEEVARTLLSEGGELPAQTAHATLLYADIEGFTSLTESLGAANIVTVLNSYFSTVVDILELHQGVATQFHGDAILATFNIPINNKDHARNAITAASEILEAIAKQEFAGQRLRVRIGIDSGPVVAGAVGAPGRLSYTVYGNSVNLAARLEQLNKNYDTDLLVSENTVKLAGADDSLHAIGEASIRGKAGVVTLYSFKEKFGAAE